MDKASFSVKYCRRDRTHLYTIFIRTVFGGHSCLIPATLLHGRRCLSYLRLQRTRIGIILTKQQSKSN